MTNKHLAYDSNLNREVATCWRSPCSVAFSILILLVMP